eukprot:145219_1
MTDSDDSSWGSDSSTSSSDYHYRGRCQINLRHFLTGLKDKEELFKQYNKERKFNRDLAKAPPTPIIFKMNEIKQLDVYLNEKWLTATVERINIHCMFVQFNERNDSCDEYVYLPETTDFILFNKTYHIMEEPVLNNDTNEFTEASAFKVLTKSIKFAPLNFHTIHYNSLQALQFKINCKPMYYYCKSMQKSYLITTANGSIYRYDIVANIWQSIGYHPEYSLQHAACIDEVNNKLYLFSTESFGVFDLQCLKWNVIQSMLLLTTQLHGWGRSNKLQVHSVVCVYQSKNNDKIDTLVVNDAIQWFDNEQKQWKDGVIMKKDKHNDIIQIKYYNWNGKIVLHKHENMSDIKIKTEMKDFVIDSNLNQRLKYITFYVVGRDDSESRQLQLDAKNGRLKICDSDSGSITSIGRYKFSSKLLLIKKPQPTLMLLGAIANFATVDWTQTEYTNILYKHLDDKWQLHDRKLPQCWSTNASNYDEYTDFVLFNDKIIIFISFDFGEIYCLDLINEEWIKHHDKTFDISFDCPMMAVYNEQECIVHLLSKSKMGKQYHLSVNVYDLIPTQLFVKEIIFGFLRNTEKECKMLIPHSLYHIIVRYYPINDNVNPYPGT